MLILVQPELHNTTYDELVNNTEGLGGKHLQKRIEIFRGDVDLAKLPPPEDQGSECCTMSSACHNFLSNRWLAFVMSKDQKHKQLRGLENWQKAMCCIQQYWTPRRDCPYPPRNVPVNWRERGKCSAGIKPWDGINQMGDPFHLRGGWPGWNGYSGW